MTIDTSLHIADICLPPLVAFGVFIVRKLWALDIRMTTLQTLFHAKFGGDHK